MKLENHFDKTDFSDGPRLSEPQIMGSTIRISARGVTLLKGHPLNLTDKPLLINSCVLVFENVKSSSRTVHEYAIDSHHDAFNPSYTLEDQIESSNNKIENMYVFDGIIGSPNAIVEWHVVAEKFLLEI